MTYYSKRDCVADLRAIRWSNSFEFLTDEDITAAQILVWSGSVAVQLDVFQSGAVQKMLHQNFEKAGDGNVKVHISYGEFLRKYQENPEVLTRLGLEWRNVHFNRNYDQGVEILTDALPYEELLELVRILADRNPLPDDFALVCGQMSGLPAQIWTDIYGVTDVDAFLAAAAREPFLSMKEIAVL